jgi:heptosyltransferase-2
MTKSDSILVVGPSWIGDMVMAQSLLKLFKEKQPDTAIDVLAPKWSLGILQRMPEVRHGIALDVKHGELGIIKRYKAGKALRSKGYKQAYVLPKTIKSALAPFFANIPIRTGFLGESRYGFINDIRPLDKVRLDQTVKKYASFGQPISDAVITPFPRLIPEQQNLDNLIKRYRIDTTKFLVALMPGAEFGPAKQWPLAHFIELAKMIGAIGGQVILFGSDKDRADGEVIVNATKNALNLCGKTTIEDAVDLISIVDIAIANDSGLMHVAASVDVPIVSIYGSTSPDYAPPLTDKGQVEWLGLECAPCRQRQCPLLHLNCLTQILPEKVFQHIESLNERRCK